MKENWQTNWEDYYQILGIDNTSDDKSIKKAYDFKKWTLHPDRMTGVPESTKQQAEQEFKRVNYAFDVLKDPQKRRQYNEEWLKRTSKRDNFSKSQSGTVNEGFTAGSTYPQRPKNEFKNTSLSRGREVLNNIVLTKTAAKILIIIGFVGLIAGIGRYLFETEMIAVNNTYTTPIVIDKATYYTKQSQWSSALYYYTQEQLLPTVTTKPDTKYHLTIDYSLFKLENNISWNQLQIGIKDEKSVTNQISRDEYMALTQNAHYKVTINEVKPKHNVVYVIPGGLVLLLGCIIFLRSKDNKHIFTATGNWGAFSEQNSATNEEIHNANVSNALKTALRNMDTTHKWYTNEDEANRELVSCLKAMGYNAVYHQYLGDGRTADAFFESSIIEAKLDPSQSEVDRLEGQIAEYLKYPYTVRIVLYGQVDYQLLLRIKEIISRRPESTFLTYLPDAKRIRKSNSL
jgi:hypothetical protein